MNKITNLNGGNTCKGTDVFSEDELKKLKKIFDEMCKNKPEEQIEISSMDFLNTVEIKNKPLFIKLDELGDMYESFYKFFVEKI